MALKVEKPDKAKTRLSTRSAPAMMDAKANKSSPSTKPKALKSSKSTKSSKTAAATTFSFSLRHGSSAATPASSRHHHSHHQSGSKTNRPPPVQPTGPLPRSSKQATATEASLPTRRHHAPPTMTATLRTRHPTSTRHRAPLSPEKRMPVLLKDLEHVRKPLDLSIRRGAKLSRIQDHIRTYIESHPRPHPTEHAVTITKKKPSRRPRLPVIERIRFWLDGRELQPNDVLPDMPPPRATLIWYRVVPAERDPDRTCSIDNSNSHGTQNETDVPPFPPAPFKFSRFRNTHPLHDGPLIDMVRHTINSGATVAQLRQTIANFLGIADPHRIILMCRDGMRPGLIQGQDWEVRLIGTWLCQWLTFDVGGEKEYVQLRGLGRPPGLGLSVDGREEVEEKDEDEDREGAGHSPWRTYLYHPSPTYLRDGMEVRRLKMWMEMRLFKTLTPTAGTGRKGASRQRLDWAGISVRLQRRPSDPQDDDHDDEREPNGGKTNTPKKKKTKIRTNKKTRKKVAADGQEKVEIDKARPLTTSTRGSCKNSSLVRWGATYNFVLASDDDAELFAREEGWLLRPTDVCTICGDTKRITDLPVRITPACAHRPTACKECLAAWLSSSLESMSWDRLRCPECPVLLPPDSVRRYAAPAVWARYERLAFRTAAEALPNFHWCLAARCESGQVHDAACPKFRCAACGARQCVHHHVPWHSGETCDEYDHRTRRRHRDDQASEAAIQMTSKKCPQCKRDVHKWTGCNHITCLCGHQWCYICFAPYYTNEHGLLLCRHLDTCTDEDPLADLINPNLQNVFPLPPRDFPPPPLHHPPNRRRPPFVHFDIDPQFPLPTPPPPPPPDLSPLNPDDAGAQPPPFWAAQSNRRRRQQQNQQDENRHPQHHRQRHEPREFDWLTATVVGRMRGIIRERR